MVSEGAKTLHASDNAPKVVVLMFRNINYGATVAGVWGDCGLYINPKPPKPKTLVQKYEPSCLLGSCGSSCTVA